MAPPAPADSTVATPRYAAAKGIRVRHWPGETTALVFAEASASTHLVEQAAAALLMAADEAHALSIAELRARIVGESDGHATAEEPELSDAQLLDAARGLADAGLLIQSP